MIILMILATAVLTLLSAICYRAGGMSQEENTNPKWIPMWLRHSWCRDWVCPAFNITTLLIWHPYCASWWWILSYCAMGGAYSDYWKKVGKNNFFFHGGFIGLAVFPFCFHHLAIWRLILQSVLMAVAIGYWRMKNTDDVKTEMGCGGIANIFRMI